MVLTRRRAAEAAAMAARQKEQQQQQQNASSPVQPDPNPTKQPPPKPPQLTLRLAYGHVCAFIAIVTTVDAARRLPHTALPVHAFILLCCTIPLRTVLALAMHSLKQPSVPSGLSLAFGAPVLFASNAIHVLAAQSDPDHLLQLIACAAMDVCANWLKMVAVAKSPQMDPFALPISFLYSASDIVLAARIAGQQPFFDLVSPLLLLRFAANTRMLLQSARLIVARDEAKKADAQHEPR